MEDSATQRAARRIVADEARVIRWRLHASRLRVPKQLDEIAGGRRGLKLADGIALLVDTMLEGRYTEGEAVEAVARVARRIAASRAAEVAGQRAHLRAG